MNNCCGRKQQNNPGFTINVPPGLFDIKATSAIGKAVEKMPVISKTQIDENLISAGDRMNEYGIDKIRDKMNALIERQSNFVRPFIDSINAVNELHNRPVQLLIDKDNLYIGALA